MANMTLTSSVFREQGEIPREYTCSGKDISPQLGWTGLPEGTRALALVLDDPDAPNGPFVHWVLYDIPSDMHELPENYSPAAGIKTGKNSFGKQQYGGPCPPKGQAHRYYFRLYAVDQVLGLPDGMVASQLMDRLVGHILGETALVGMFGR